MLYTTTLLTTFFFSTCPGGQCPVPYEMPVVVQTPTPIAQTPVVPSPTTEAIVRIVNHVNSRNSAGSGTVVVNDADRAVVLTCAHLFSDGVGSVEIGLADGRRVEARLIGLDRRWDLAALVTSPLTGVRPPPIAADSPQNGEPLSSCGYGQDGRLFVNHGVMRGYIRLGGTPFYETIQLTGFARQGDSGGPILNRAGELVAVLWGSDGQTVTGTYCGRIRRFLAQLLGKPSNEAAPNEAPRYSDDAAAERKNLIGRLGQLTGGVSKLHDGLESVAGRLKQVEGIASKVGSIAARVEGISSKVEKLGLAGVSGGSSAKVAMLTTVLTALGWTTPPSLALMLGLRIGSKILRRRVRKRLAAKKKESQAASQATPAATTTTTTKPSGGTSARPTINDDYGKQLAQVYALSGRSAIGDLTLGREYDEELRQASVSSDAQLAKWADELRKRVADRFNRIHSESPSPADPIV